MKTDQSPTSASSKGSGLAPHSSSEASPDAVRTPPRRPVYPGDHRRIERVDPDKASEC